MECGTCQASNREGRRFCARCGAPLGGSCPACGFANEPGERFCGGCGQALTAASDPGPRAAPPSLPAATDSRPSEGERRNATVLFADLAGYSLMNEVLDPEEVGRFIQRLKGEAVRIVEAHGGIVNQFVGDEVLALFGIPSAFEDDPVRAVRAALGLHEMVRRASLELEPRLGQPVRLHTGINTGLIVTHRGDSRDGRVGITGTTVNVGARLKLLAGEDEIVVGPETERLIADFFRTEALTPIVLKGMARSITPARVLGASDVRTRFEAAERRGLTRYIGRDGELAVLRECLQRALGSDGQFVTVSGEAGMGKSRLLHEFRRGLDPERLSVLEGRCQPYGADTPYLPFLNVLRQAMHLRDEDPLEDCHEKVVHFVRTLDPALERVLPFCLHLLAIPSASHPMPREARAMELKDAFEDTFAQTVIGFARLKPVVLALEDWHWADEASRSALRRLIELAPGQPVLIVLLHRPGETPPGWGQPAILTGIGLHALSGEGTERMIASILQVERIPPGLAGVIHERTAGNPLFTEELCKALRDDGTLVIHRDSVRLTRAQQDLQMPHSVEAVIRSRLDRLDPDALTTLRLASVVGRFFGGRLLSRLVPERLALSECLERLLSREQIQAAGRSSEPEYRFKHSLTQQVVYETLLLSERQELHERVGAAIAELYADRIEEQVETLAHHFERSGNAERAVQYHEMAARKAAGTYAFSVSGSHYAKAFGRLGAWAPTPERLEKAIRIALRWANVSQGEPSPELLAALESLLEGARGSGNKLLYARLLRHTGWVRLCLGQFPLALALLNESKDLSRSLEDRQQNAHVLNWLGRAYWGTEQFVLAIRNLREGLDLYGEPGYEAEAGLSLSYLSISLGGVGDFPEAERVGRRAVDLGKEIGNKACESWAWNALATVQALRGNWAECRRLVIDHLQMAMAVGNSLPIAMNRFCLGDVEHHLGSRAQGFEQMQQALASARALGTAFMDRHQAYLACCAAQQGLEAEARLCLERFAAARLGRNRGQVYALCAQAYLDARSGSTGAEGVRARMGEALGLAAELRLLPDLARCQLACAELLARAGDSDGAQEALKRALESFGALGMDWWREQAHSLRGRIEQGRLSLEWAQ